MKTKMDEFNKSWFSYQFFFFFLKVVVRQWLMGKNENKKQMWVCKYLELQMLIEGLGLFDRKYFFKNFCMYPEKRET